MPKKRKPKGLPRELVPSPVFYADSRRFRNKVKAALTAELGIEKAGREKIAEALRLVEAILGAYPQ